MTRPLLRLARSSLPAAVLCLLAAAGAAPARAQGPASSGGPGPDVDLAALRAAPGVDTAALGWIERTLAPAERREVFGLVRALSKPDAAQVLAAYPAADGMIRSATVRRFADSIAVRQGDGDAGAVRVAYLAARTRHTLLDQMAQRGYPVAFDASAFALPAPVPRTPRELARARHLRLSFDFGPLDTLLAIVGTADVPPREAMGRVASHPFDALIEHHSQSFYPIALSRELLGLALARAASTAPLDRLYAYAVPTGLLHYAELRAYEPEYRALVDSLHRNAPRLVAAAVAQLAPYVPDGVVLERRVSFFVVDWSDGWGAQDVTAVDLEYYKSDVPRLLGTLTHETYHAVQGAAREARARAGRRPAAGRSAADSALIGALGYVFDEGTANFVAPSMPRTPESADSMAREGARLLAAVVEAGRTAPHDAARVRKLLDAGVAGGGPFYWLGSAMARRIVDAFGPATLGELIGGDPLDFARTYLRAPGRPLLDVTVVAAIGGIRR